MEAISHHAQSLEGGSWKELLDEIEEISFRQPPSGEHRKKWGQYTTPPEIAAYMASLLPDTWRRNARILDPGAGPGILGVAAAVQALQQGAESVELVALEADEHVLPTLQEVLGLARRRLGPRLKTSIRTEDFLDADQPSLEDVPLAADFDVAIANPPYFKISPKDARGGGAPNIYARFMEISGRLLKDGGALVFVVPRSFASGFYFRGFRRRFFGSMALDRVHVFESRRDAFKKHAVLQENIILRCRKGHFGAGEVEVTSSAGAEDLIGAAGFRVPRELLVDLSDRNAALFLPTSPEQAETIREFHRLPCRLVDYGLEVSTGPVVPFRTEALVDAAGTASSFPMLWMNHVQYGKVEWPLGSRCRKPEHILKIADEKLLVPNSTYVLVRRFSAKEDKRRLTAAVLNGGELPGEMIGLENHLNFVRRPGGELEGWEATAICALLNSDALDGYFRILSGNTQVSATELRSLPLPEPHVLRAVMDELSGTDWTPDDLVKRLFDGHG